MSRETPNCPLTRDFQVRVEKLRRFATMVEETLVARAAGLEMLLTDQGTQIPSDDRADLFEHYADDMFERADELPTILRYSVLTSLDAAFETHLNDTCATHRPIHSPGISLQDLKGSGTERSRRYLTKVAGIRWPDDDMCWSTVLRLHEVRNCIVHADGAVDLSRGVIEKWASSFPGLRITHDRVVSLDAAFTHAAVDAYQSFALTLDATLAGLSLWQSVFPIEEM